MAYPAQVRLRDVGMRDGFQMEAKILSTEDKISVGRNLIAAGMKRLEATSFVSPAAVPQLADAAEVVAGLQGLGCEISALVPNPRGAERAAAAGVDRATIFASASETHNQKNVRRSTADSLAGAVEIGRICRAAGVVLGGSVATSFGCPYEGNIGLDAVLRVVEAYAGAGADEVSLGDTTGMATPPLVRRIAQGVRARFPELSLVLHFHNTRGMGLVNVMAGLEIGIDAFESSIGGLGGCPFAIGATGNVCSEDLVHMLDELGVDSGVDLMALIAVARQVEQLFGRELPGQVMKAGPRMDRPPRRTIQSRAM